MAAAFELCIDGVARPEFGGEVFFEGDFEAVEDAGVCAEVAEEAAGVCGGEEDVLENVHGSTIYELRIEVEEVEPKPLEPRVVEGREDTGVKVASYFLRMMSWPTTVPGRGSREWL